MKLFAGVDIGSTTSKCIIIDESGSVLTFQVLYTEFDRNLSGEKVLNPPGTAARRFSRLTTIFRRLLPTASVHT